MTYVYHIREIGNTDLSKGYIGVTVDPYLRKIKHFIALREGAHVNKHLQCAYDKYDEIEFVILLESSEDYCYEIENLLRPNEYMGWNIIPGGKSSALEATRLKVKNGDHHWQTKKHAEFVAKNNKKFKGTVCVIDLEGNKFRVSKEEFIRRRGKDLFGVGSMKAKEIQGLKLEYANRGIKRPDVKNRKVNHNMSRNSRSKSIKIGNITFFSKKDAYTLMGLSDYKFNKLYGSKV